MRNATHKQACRSHDTPDFGSWPYLNRGGDIYAHHITIGPTGFSDPPYDPDKYMHFVSF